ncbi:hypothetical protein SH2C18_48940 [Clostridium sediminicola]|uniref:hypothetical protein n=1 Tax=Clostridium sediminicola TaxID=3114879 RepID=UPI0031F226DD
MARLVVKLKQHTPMIHFQHDQEKAALRGSDLKPRLDKFLINERFKEFDNYKIYLKGYKIGKEKCDFEGKEALDYKVNIKGIGNKRVEYIHKNFPLYFGNMGSDKKNEFVFYDSVEVEFFSLYKDLIKEIVSELPKFFMKNNFGVRQSKGFGSFFIDEKAEYFLDGKVYKFIDLNKVKGKNNKTIVNYMKNDNTWWGLFDGINKYYTRIRKGGRNTEPLIKKFFSEKDIVWEKDAIHKIYCNKNKKYNIENVRVIKDLLGLSTNEYWKTYGITIEKEHISENVENKITRFQSPIFFKPIKVDNKKFNVYYEFREIPEEYLGQEFKITAWKNNKSKKKKEKQLGELKIKTPSEFNMEEFLKFVKR